MTRRSLLASLAAAIIDPERLLWVPGKKLISIPTARPLLSVGDVVTIAGSITPNGPRWTGKVGRYAINHRTGEETGILQRFVVTQVVPGGNVQLFPRPTAASWVVPAATVTPVLTGRLWPLVTTHVKKLPA